MAGFHQYRIFSGHSYAKVMPELVNAGFVPVGFDGVMRFRLEAVRQSKSLKIGSDYLREELIKHPVDCGDGLAFYKGVAKIVYDSEHLRKVDFGQFIGGGLEISVDDFESFKGSDLNRGGGRLIGVPASGVDIEESGKKVLRFKARKLKS